MTNKQLTVKVPGKLMLAGEYAVLEPNYELIVLAVNRFVYATLELTDTSTVTLENYHLTNIPWTMTDEGLHIDSADTRKTYVECAMEISLTYLQENNISWQPFSLTIKSELDDDQSGRKYGLGSSAAVTTAVISIVLEKFAPAEVSKDIIFKLAAITHIKIQGNGSGADIAASTYGGVLAYQSFQADWLKEKYANTKTLTKLVNSHWDYLHIEQLKFPTDSIKFAVGWTGQPASTGQLVAKILQLKHSNAKAFETFLHNSQQAVAQIKQAIISGDKDLFFQGINNNRQALSTLGHVAGAPIETPSLGDLSELAQKVGGAGKLSGAGGGDCGIAFVSSDEEITELKNKWCQVNIIPLPLQIQSVGTTIYTSR